MRIATCLASLLLTAAGPLLQAKAETAGAAPAPSVTTPSVEVLSADQWQRVDGSVEKALAWLALQQRRDGSFPTRRSGQPGVTGLCVLAFLANGHLPGEGPYGDSLSRAVAYIVRQQKPNGLIAYEAPPMRGIPRSVPGPMGTAIVYNHAIASLAVSEVYGLQGVEGQQQLATVIERALEASLRMQRWDKQPNDRGGWRYLFVHPFGDSDLSITGWELMFLRSSQNAGFKVPQKSIDDAVDYVRRCFDEEYGVFEYEKSHRDRRSRAMAGAGVLALAHAGFHNSREAQLSGEWILRHGFEDYNVNIPFSRRNFAKDRYHYSVFNCSQAMYQLGGDFWAKFFPPTAMTLVTHQHADGSWPPESHQEDRQYGAAYTTALTTLALSAPNQLLPIFQR